MIFNNDLELKEKDIQMILESVNATQALLIPMKATKNQYAKYTKRLGQMRPDSSVVKQYIPMFAAELYMKQDRNYKKVVEDILQNDTSANIREMFETLNPDESDEQLTAHTAEELTFDDIVSFIKKYQESHSMDAQLFLVQLREMKLELTQEEEQIVKEAIGGETETEVETAVEKSTPIKPKITATKKKSEKTAEEKAAQSKAARERQEAEKKKQEELEQSSQKEEQQMPTKKDELVEEILGAFTLKQEQNMENSDNKLLVGKVNIRNNSYYNFTPIGYLINGTFDMLRKSQVDELIPKSVYRNINLFYRTYDDTEIEFMKEHFHEDQLVIFEYDLKNLEENYAADGTLNPTGYRVPALDGVKKRKIRLLSDEGYYPLYPSDILLDDITTTSRPKVDYESIQDGEKILINMKNGFYAGPYVVTYRSTINGYEIVTDLSKNKYLLKGYKSTDCKRVSIDEDSDTWDTASWDFYNIKPRAKEEVMDAISDKELMNSLSDILSQDGKTAIDVNNIGEAVNLYEESIISGKFITEEIRNDRIERLQEILSSAKESKGDRDSILEALAEFVPSAANENQDVTQENIELRRELQYVQEQNKQLSSELEASKSENQVSIDSAELETLRAKANESNDAGALEKRVRNLEKNVDYLENHKQHLLNDTKDLESKFVELVNNYSQRIVDITFDGYMSAKMMQAAATWEDTEEDAKLTAAVEKINALDEYVYEPNSLMSYVVSLVRRVRPGYTFNDIVNIMTCTTQGFLTVFSGAPGCGKTSICNILADVLGLNKFNSKVENVEGISNVNRFVSVSVERGWTSKRDLVGYYNPLTKKFEESNRAVFDGLKALDIESKKKINKYPYMILLDEANLSPMEYYWADFMNVCDDLSDNNTINLGNKNVLEIPETLHFVATINNDFTTEVLSPRLVDRAWVVTLPKAKTTGTVNKISADEISIVPWESLKKAFVVGDDVNVAFAGKQQRVYEGIKEMFSKQNISISPRVDRAIYKYCYAASRLMTTEEDRENREDTGIISLDYAVAQKILPKIAGSGDAYNMFLTELETYCRTNDLNYSADIVNGIISRGDSQMMYYQFFN